jgi:hypothetical protein
MSQMSDYLENKIIDLVFRGQAYTAPVVYVGLYTAAPSDSGGGTEVSGNAYARVKTAVGSTQALTDWKSSQNDSLASTGTGGNTTNTNAINFATPTATWGTVTHFALYDALTGGNELFWGPLTISKTINQSDTVTFPAGTLSVTFA